LGLPISRQFVELMGGEIAVHSQAGQGTTVTFDVLVELADLVEVQPLQPARRVAGLAPDQPVAGEGPYRILVVDDSQDNRIMLCQLLEAVGFEVLEAADGREALEKFSSWEPHLVWIDMRMPVMDGYEVTRRIKTTGLGQSTPVIALTASAFEEERAEVLAAGCDDFVRKPIREAEIFGVMGEHLGLRYIYEEIASPEERVEDAPLRVDLLPADLEDLPAEWVADLRQAAMGGRSQRLLDLIAQIETDHPTLAAELRALVRDYRFRQIVVLTE
jgi:CheY-like chemotaxis protein